MYVEKLVTQANNPTNDTFVFCFVKIRRKLQKDMFFLRISIKNNKGGFLMKKYLWLIPAAAFQYTFCTWLSYCFLSMHFTGSIISTALGYLCVFCFFAAIICNIIFMIAVRKEEPRRIVIAAFILKLIHIPTYILIFAIGCMMGIMWFMTFPFILFLIAVDILTMFISGMVSVFSVARNAKGNAASSVLTIICQFVFCLDVISLSVFTLKCVLKKPERKF